MKKYILLWILIVNIGCSNSHLVEMEGRVAVKGSMPFTYLVIEDTVTHKSYKIQNSKDFDLIHQQKKIIKIKAELIKKAVGPGFPAEIKVIEVI